MRTIPQHTAPESREQKTRKTKQKQKTNSYKRRKWGWLNW
jgi:hypothetical protein